MRFTFWEGSESDGNHFFLLTPPAMVEVVPTKFAATPIWSVEAADMHEAETKLLLHMGWGPMNPLE